MGKNFKEFWKRQIAKVMAVTMTLSTLCSAGVPVVHAGEVNIPTTQLVDGRIISETAMQKLADGGTWADSFAFTADVLTTIFGTTIGTFENGTTIDLAKDINTWTAEEDAPIAELAKDIDASTWIPITLEGNGKRINLRLVAFHSAVSADNALQNQTPVVVNGKMYSELTAAYFGREGSLVNRENMLSIGLGSYASSAELDTRFDTTLNDITGVSSTTTPITEATTYVGKTYSIWKDASGFVVNNLPYINTAEYSDFDHTPTIMIVPSPVQARKIGVIAYDVTGLDEIDESKTVPVTVNYVTESGVTLVEGQETSEKVTATVTLPDGYQWADGENGVVNFGYYDESGIVRVVRAERNVEISVVDKFNNSVTLSEATVALEQNVDGVWTSHGTMPNWQLTDAQKDIIHAAASTNNSTFRVVNSGYQPGYNVDTSYISFDAKIPTNITKQFQEVARYKVVVANITGSEPVVGATYNFTYGTDTDTLTTDAYGYAYTEIFDDIGTQSFKLQQITTGDGFVLDGVDEQTLSLAAATINYGDNCFVLHVSDSDPVYIPPDYNHAIEISIVDDMGIAIEGVKVGVYTDVDCTNAAVPEEGTMPELISGADGKIAVPEVPAGNYYIKLISSTSGYSNSTFDPANDTPTSVFAVAVEDNDDTAHVDMGVVRQRAEITLYVKNNLDKPVEGVRYKLILKEADPASYAGTIVGTNIELGEYVTDATGAIKVDTMGKGPFAGQKLINGTYALEFVSCPETHKPPVNTIPDVQLKWSEGKSVVTASHTTYLNVYNTYTFNISIEDADLADEELYTRYANIDDTIFADAFNNTVLTHVAYLVKGQEMTLTMRNLEPIQAMIDGALVTIPTDTVLVTRPINGQTDMTLTTMMYQPEGYDAPIEMPIPVGAYGFHIDEAGIGYNWEGHNQSFGDYDDYNSEVNVTLTEKITLSDVKITKTDDKTNAPIKGITFALVNLDVLIAHGMDITDTTIDNRDVTEFLTDEGIGLRHYAVSDDNGVVDFGKIPYGTYWLVEIYDNKSADYAVTAPQLVNINGAPINAGVTNTSMLTYIVINNKAANNSAIAGATFALKEAGNDTPYVSTADANGQVVSDKAYMNGEFTVENTKASAGYLLAADVVIKADNGVWSVIENGTEKPLTRRWDDSLQKWVISVDVISGQNTLIVDATFDGAHMSNVEFEVYDENDVLVQELTSNEGENTIVGLAAGTYIIKQIGVPGFVTPTDKTIVVDDTTPAYNVTFTNEKTLVTVKTFDAIGGWELNGVVVELIDADGNVVATFNDTNKSHQGIPAGEYTLHTVTMPNGYQATPDITIVVEDIATEQIFINNALDNDAPAGGGEPAYIDNRTYGTIELEKLDSVDGKPLANVEFALKYAEDVVINGSTVLAGTTIDTFTTDAEGKATLTQKVAIATYTENGIVPIHYAIVETKLPEGQYVAGNASADLNDIVFEYAGPNTALIVIDDIKVYNDRPDIVVTAVSDPDTRMFDENGNVAGHDSITVLQNGQKITYTITVENKGTATGYDIDIRDVLPAEFEITNASAGTYTFENGAVYWHVPEVAPGEKVTLILEVIANANGATILDNKIDWTMPDTPYGPDEELDKDDENVQWNDLPTFEYQIIAFIGSHNEREIIMSAYDVVGFTYSFNSVAELENFRVTNQIPEGLSYVEGTAKLNGAEHEDFKYNEATRTLEYIPSDEWVNSLVFTFDVTVDHINNGKEFEWENSAKATFLANAYTNTELTAMTDVTTILADAMLTVEYDTDTETFIGDVDEMTNVTVLKKDDKVRHTIYLYNDGISSLRKIMLQDILPENTVLQPVATDGVFMAVKNNEVIWFINEIEPGESLELVFDSVVNEQKAGLLINSAKYDLMTSNPVIQGQTATFPEFKNTARNTDASVYQVVEFHKTAEVKGKTVTDGKVAIGDTLIYTMSVTAEELVKGIVVTDKLPAGVTFVPGSAQYKLAGDTEWSVMNDVAIYDATTRTIKFFTDKDATGILSANAGVNYFRFSVTVDRIGSNNANNNNYNMATFTNVAELEYRSVANDADSTVELESEAITHMTEISVSGDKTGSVDTFEGVYADRKNVTVVVNGDEIVFNISVKNSGANALTNVVVEDAVPTNTTLVAKDGDTFTHNNGVLTWVIPEIKADETATVSFTVKVAAPANTAVEIINQAKYAVPVDVNNIKTSEWIETNSVVYQVISVVLSSSVEGGIAENDAKTVEIGSTITYTITVECVDDIYGLNLKHKIPEGMEFVQDSAKVKVGDAAAEAARFTLDGNTIIFTQFDEVKAGKLAVSFDVKVKDTDEYDKGVTFINQSEVSLKPVKDSDKKLELKTNPISHTTKKTNATDTPQLGLETTSASLVWGLITIVALAGMGVFGYFGFIEPRKKRED